MKVLSIIITALILYLNTSLAFSQEWKSLASYKKETGFSSLQDGCWLKKDRRRQNEVWKQANIFNLSRENGNRKYKTIREKRDFYLWFDLERKKQGHEIKWIGIAAIAAGQLSKLDAGFIRCFFVRNKEVVKFANEGSEKVLEFAFPLLNKIYFSNKIIKGEDAVNWSLEYGKKEQCQILEPLYKNLSSKALQKLNRMVKGKGLFKFGVAKRLRFEGSIEDCEARIDHATYKMLSFYARSQENKPTVK